MDMTVVAMASGSEWARYEFGSAAAAVAAAAAIVPVGQSRRMRWLVKSRMLADVSPWPGDEKTDTARAVGPKTKPRHSRQESRRRLATYSRPDGQVLRGRWQSGAAVVVRLAHENVVSVPFTAGPGGAQQRRTTRCRGSEMVLFRRGLHPAKGSPEPGRESRV